MDGWMDGWIGYASLMPAASSQPFHPPFKTVHPSQNSYKKPLLPLLTLKSLPVTLAPRDGAGWVTWPGNLRQRKKEKGDSSLTLFN